MPTALLRHSITETPAIRDSVDVALRTWPELDGDRAAAIRRLVVEGYLAIENGTDSRTRAIMAAAGAFTGVYRPGAAEALKQEWPA